MRGRQIYPSEASGVFFVVRLSIVLPGPQMGQNNPLDRFINVIASMDAS